LVADIGKLLPEFDDLDRWTLEEQTEALAAALDEARPEDYAGSSRNMAFPWAPA